MFNKLPMSIRNLPVSKFKIHLLANRLNQQAFIMLNITLATNITGLERCKCYLRNVIGDNLIATKTFVLECDVAVSSGWQLTASKCMPILAN